ncbi:DNA recombination protein RmuC [Coralloluteibacterium thermophilus]|uniref:DNA recombination protein RmuC n=1 Tax=Coralloluteibacterium thermophilum TaxID=2707049 RepID=A0ABV9NN15_9GAMM
MPDVSLLLVLCLLLGLAVAVLAALQLRRRPAPADPALLARLDALKGDGERLERTLREEQRQARADLQGELARFEGQLQRQFEQLTAQLGARLEGFDQRLGQFTERTEGGLEGLRQTLTRDAQAGRAEAAQTLGRFGETLQTRFDRLGEGTERRLAEVRATLEARLKDIQQDNAAKLESMRQTVDEKLQSTLEARLGESFRVVSEQLRQVHQGLGEMQALATGVGDLKRVLTNVKTRGIWGEVQLGSVLEHVLTPDQYAANVAPRPGSGERVEYAIRLPGQGEAGDGDAPCWLPIDAKFPREDYERLLEAQDAANAEAVAAAAAALERRVREEARSIAAKYVEPPHTTDFALLFLPTEGLYAEVLRRPGLIESLQREHRVVVAGPTTLAAILNSLRMGFRTLAIEKRSSEVWQVLGAVRTEFGKFGGVLDKVKKQLAAATNSIESAGVRTRAIERRLRGVEAVPVESARDLLGVEALGVDPDDGDESRDGQS